MTPFQSQLRRDVTDLLMSKGIGTTSGVTTCMGQMALIVSYLNGAVYIFDDGVELIGAKDRTTLSRNGLSVDDFRRTCVDHLAMTIAGAPAANMRSDSTQALLDAP